MKNFNYELSTYYADDLVRMIFRVRGVTEE